MDSLESYEELRPLINVVKESPEVFATGDVTSGEFARHATKFIFDQAISYEALATVHINGLLKSLQNYNPAPQTRAQAKAEADVTRDKPPPLPPFTATPLEQLYIDGMNVDQIWEQLELRSKNVLQVLEAIVEPEKPDDDAATSTSDSGSAEDSGGTLAGMEAEDDDDMDLDMDDIDHFDEMDSEDGYGDEDDDTIEFTGQGLVDEDKLDMDDAVEEETVTKLHPPAEEPELDLDRPRGGRSMKASKRPGHPLLDDGFFSIDDFNRETEELESTSRSRGGLDDDDDEGEDVDLFNPLEEEHEAFDEDDLEDGGKLIPMYSDFFAAPARPAPSRLSKRSHPEGHEAVDSPNFKKPKTTEDTSQQKRGVTFNDSVKVKTIEARKNSPKERLELFKRLGMHTPLDGDDEGDDWQNEDLEWDINKLGGKDEVNGWPDETDLGSEDKSSDEEDDEAQRGVETIQRLKNDLFNDTSDDEGAETYLSEHAKRQAALAEEIALFEAENTGQKDWTLMGEATARARPKNSLLEEDLDFERTGGSRAAPVITEEKTKSLEDRIKARIVEARFDDVVRRREVDEKAFLPSRLIELQDTKSSRSLAQIYEDDFTASRTTADGGEALIDDRDGKLAQEHDELEKMWGAICYKLDALSNAHFTPKQPSATISTISNLSTTTLEAALPTTSSTATLLAPEEVVAPASSSSLRSRSEMTPQEKRSARSKERKARQKRSDAVKQHIEARNRPKNIREAKDVALKSLVKNGKGVTIVGKDAARLKGGKGQTVSRARGATGTQNVPLGDGKKWKL